MTTTRESIFAALFTAASGVSNATVRRNEPRPDAIPSGGLVVQRDGGAAPPPTEIVLSPYTAFFDEIVDFELVVQSADPDDREADLDALIAAFGTAINADRTLGGLIEDLRAGLPVKGDEAVEGAAPIKWALVPVTLTYALTDTLV